MTRHIEGLGISVDAPIPASLDVWSLRFALCAAIAIFRFKAGMIPTLAASCAAGAVLHALGLVAATPLGLRPCGLRSIKENEYARNDDGVDSIHSYALHGACNGG
jgi:hypothetical protein